jgi:hypothetical protein
MDCFTSNVGSEFRGKVFDFDLVYLTLNFHSEFAIIL